MLPIFLASSPRSIYSNLHIVRPSNWTLNNVEMLLHLHWFCLTSVTQTAPVLFVLSLYCLRRRSNRHKGAVTEKIRQPLPATFHRATRLLHSGHGWPSIQASFSPDVLCWNRFPCLHPPAPQLSTARRMVPMKREERKAESFHTHWKIQLPPWAPINPGCSPRLPDSMFSHRAGLSIAKTALARLACAAQL